MILALLEVAMTKPPVLLHCPNRKTTTVLLPGHTSTWRPKRHSGKVWDGFAAFRIALSKECLLGRQPGRQTQGFPHSAHYTERSRAVPRPNKPLSSICLSQRDDVESGGWHTPNQRVVMGLGGLRGRKMRTRDVGNQRDQME
jgi:hypothetical protein